MNILKQSNYEDKEFNEAVLLVKEELDCASINAAMELSRKIIKDIVKTNGLYGDEPIHLAINEFVALYIVCAAIYIDDSDFCFLTYLGVASERNGLRSSLVESIRLESENCDFFIDIETAIDLLDMVIERAEILVEKYCSGSETLH